jgi:hypothetical protein
VSRAIGAAVVSSDPDLTVLDGTRHTVALVDPVLGERRVEDDRLGQCSGMTHEGDLA